MTDAEVAEYLRLTSDQVRVLRQRPAHVACAACADVHPTFPTITMHHSPCCSGQGKCAGCGATMPELGNGHAVGLICEKCYNE